MPESTESQVVPQPHPAKHTLSGFVEDNHKLISVLGVFTAITIFASNLPVRPIAGTFSFLSMTLTIILWLELWAKFPSGEAGWRLVLFENVVSMAVLVIILYWLIDYRSEWDQFLFLLMFLLLLTPISLAIKRHSLFNRLFGARPGKKTGLRYAFGVILILALATLSFFIAAKVTPSIDRFFETVISAPATSTP